MRWLRLGIRLGRTWTLNFPCPDKPKHEKRDSAPSKRRPLQQFSHALILSGESPLISLNATKRRLADKI